MASSGSELTKIVQAVNATLYDTIATESVAEFDRLDFSLIQIPASPPSAVMHCGRGLSPVRPEGGVVDFGMGASNLLLVPLGGPDCFPLTGYGPEVRWSPCPCCFPSRPRWRSCED